MEKIILENDALVKGDLSSPTSFDSWLHAQLVNAEFGDARAYNIS